jgi:hypothetical protein
MLLFHRVEGRGRSGDGSARLGEEHVGGGKALAFAVVKIEDEVVFGDEIAGVEAEEMGGLVDGVMRAFEFDVGADGGFVVVDKQILSPFVTSGEFVGRAELFVSEPAAETETFENFLEGKGLGENCFEFLSNLVAVIARKGGRADGELFGRRFEGEEMTRWGFFGGGLFPFCFSGCGRLGADSKELAMLGQTTVGGIKEKILLVDAGSHGLGTELCEGAEERFGVGYAELNFDFGWHGEIVRKKG